MKKQKEVDSVTVEHKVDLHWNDEHVFPSVINPDLEFLCEKMTSETINAAYMPDGLFLDVGCGRAVDAIQLLEKGMRGVGIEVSDFMIEEAKKSLAEKNLKMDLVRAFGENLPFADSTFDVVYCKGAIDHFYNPQAAICEMARVAKPDGWVIISVANFDSAGFRLGRFIFEMRRSKPEGKLAWDTPDDHTIRVNYRVLKTLVSHYLHQEKIWGTSLLFGVPKYGGLLNRFPQPLTKVILNSLNLFARYFPSYADVLLLRGHPRHPLPDYPL